MMNLVLGFGSPSLPATILQKCSPPPLKSRPSPSWGGPLRHPPSPAFLVWILGSDRGLMLLGLERVVKQIALPRVVGAPLQFLPPGLRGSWAPPRCCLSRLLPPNRRHGLS